MWRRTELGRACTPSGVDPESNRLDPNDGRVATVLQVTAMARRPCRRSAVSAPGGCAQFNDSGLGNWETYASQYPPALSRSVRVVAGHSRERSSLSVWVCLLWRCASCWICALTQVVGNRCSTVQKSGRCPTASNDGRSRNMRANRRADSKPEVTLRSGLHRLGCRFRKDFRIDLDGVRVRPDIVFTRQKVAVFVDGCFWHVCPIHGRYPTVHEWYWTPKLRRNVERDRIADRALIEAGWAVVRVWEHERSEDAIRLVVSRLHT